MESFLLLILFPSTAPPCPRWEPEHRPTHAIVLGICVAALQNCCYFGHPLLYRGGLSGIPWAPALGHCSHLPEESLNNTWIKWTLPSSLPPNHIKLNSKFKHRKDKEKSVQYSIYGQRGTIFTFFNHQRTTSLWLIRSSQVSVTCVLGGVLALIISECQIKCHHYLCCLWSIQIPNLLTLKYGSIREWEERGDSDMFSPE